MEIKAGIVGYGYMGHYHHKRIDETDGMSLVAVYDVDINKCDELRNTDIIIYNSLENLLLDDAIDLIIICTPNDVHAEIAIEALRHKKNVLCEKPATLSLCEMKRVIAEAKENGKIFTVHQNRRWDTDYKVVKRVINESLVGQPTTIISQTFGQRGVCFGWRADPQKGGGMVFDWGIHLIDQVLMLYPNNAVVGVYARLRSILTPVVDDYFEIELELDNDIIAHISVGTFALQEQPRWFIFGDKGTLKLNDFSGSSGGLARIRSGIQKFKRVDPNAVLGPSRTMAHLEKGDLENLPLPEVIVENNFYANLCKALNGEEAEIVTYEEMIRDMEVIEKVFESSKLGQKLKVKI